ncbi:retropepsin-like aspartic protease [Duganella violaceipulchra]|uniref:Aspartyl protease n=2 Tax=Duganella violaceipulchra TaxID=2849652 RepID=A0AA41L3B8_9BURK|nr:retropepsin-like aspartic protease [Duganella violaceicalia]MBV6323773.1 retropepsin-like domain-containing protein [Duganella violaceicalia]MCP2007463.1 putative aspartyl protease [Duganella violaceicalia]
MQKLKSSMLLLPCARATLAASLWLSASLAVPPALAAETPPPQTHILPSMFHKGFVYLKVSVNQLPEAWMILDSGTTESIVDQAYARQIGLTLTPSLVPQATFGTTQPQNYNTDTVRLRVGQEAEGVVAFESIALGMTGPDGAPAAGMLGRTYLEGKAIVIDYPHSLVYLETLPQPADPRDVPMSLKTGIPVIALNIGGKTVPALIDTGGTYDMIITPATAKELGIEKLMAEAKPAQTMGHGGAQAIVVGKAPEFTVGALTVRDQRAAYTDFGTATDSVGAGVSLGIGFLKKYKITLNYVAQTVRFER